MTEIILTQTEAASRPFALYHGADLPAAPVRLEIGAQFSAGAFGSLHSATALDGRPPVTPLVAKLFDAHAFGKHGMSPVVDSLRDLHDALGRHSQPDWPDGIRALPYAVYRARHDGQDTLVALMLDLRAMGYAPAPFTDSQRLQTYMGLPLEDRIGLATSLSERVGLLEAIGFVHGDLNAENLLMDVASGDVQIIDFDSGILVKRGDERPRTPGKQNDCMPPEVKGTGSGPLFEIDKFVPEAERWAVGSLMGYCLFAFHPGFFLRVISRAVIAEYAQQGGPWPRIDQQGPLFTDIPENVDAYRVLLPEMLSLPQPVQDAFGAFFDAGLTGSRRPRAADWRAALTSLTVPPTIDRFEVDETVAYEGMAVNLTWRVANAREVVIDGHGKQPASGLLRLVATSSSAFTIRAVNGYGESVAYTEPLRVMPVPTLQFVPVPSAPALSFETRIPVVGVGPADGTDWLGALNATFAAPPVALFPPSAPDLAYVAFPAGLLAGLAIPGIPAAPDPAHLVHPPSP